MISIGRKDLFVISHWAFSIFHLAPVKRFVDRIILNDWRQERLGLLIDYSCSIRSPAKWKMENDNWKMTNGSLLSRSLALRF